MKIHFIKIYSQNRWKIMFLLTLGILLAFAVTPRGYAKAQSSNESPAFPYVKQFIISGYYSPLPNQSRYVTGSYEGDVRLNGDGVRAADNTIVYPGMVASGKNYPFGTKMQIPGIGTVAVHDRGGAIKENRLDIWFGQGEEGLRRALGWGMRTVDVTVYGIDPGIQEVVDFSSVPLADIARIPVTTKHFKSDIAKGDSGDEVLELQRFLKKLGIFNEETTGYFGDETAEAVLRFQLEYSVITGPEDSGAGNFGPKSRFALEELLNEREAELKNNLPAPSLFSGNQGETVKNLQALLNDYGFLKMENMNGLFDAKTLDALIRFQLDNGVIATQADFGAGVYGPKTKLAFEKLFEHAYSPATSLIVKSRSNVNQQDVKVFTRALALNDTGADVASLQEELARLHFLGLQPTGYFGTITQHAVFKFQQSFEIVQEKTDEGAGIVGPKTMEKLNELMAARQDQTRLISETTRQKEIVDKRVADERTLVAQAAAAAVDFSGDLGYGNRGGEVHSLQKIMKQLGFFKGKFTTEYYGDITKASVLAFQKSHGLEESGALDEKTRKVLNKIVREA